MIRYSQLTFREFADKIMDRVSKFNMDISLEYLQISAMLNAAKREIFLKLMPLKDWAYIRTIEIEEPANNTALVGGEPPPDIPSDRLLYGGSHTTGRILNGAVAIDGLFWKPVRVMAKFIQTPDSLYEEEQQGSSQYFHEARYVSVKEYWRLTNRTHPSTRNTINIASRYFSIYTIWGHHIVNVEEENDDFAKSMLVFYCYPYNMRVRLDYYAIPENIFKTQFGPDGTMPIGVPAEFEQLIIDAVLERIYYKLGNTDKFTDMYGKVKREVNRLRAIRNQLNMTQAISQESLPNPQPSNIPSVILSNKQ